MNSLPHEIELEKVLNVIKEVAPTFKVPELYMFQFVDRNDIFGNASSCGEIYLSMRTLGEFNCKNTHFISTIVHEVVHLNCWDCGHNQDFKNINELLFGKVSKKLTEMEVENERDTVIKANKHRPVS